VSANAILVLMHTRRDPHPVKVDEQLCFSVFLVGMASVESWRGIHSAHELSERSYLALLG
jgi:hypothetical protein